eukprot:3561707-Prymnesium_polylepis.1
MGVPDARLSTRRLEAPEDHGHGHGRALHAPRHLQPQAGPAAARRVEPLAPAGGGRRRAV